MVMFFTDTGVAMIIIGIRIKMSTGGMNQIETTLRKKNQNGIERIIIEAEIIGKRDLVKTGAVPVARLNVTIQKTLD